MNIGISNWHNWSFDLTQMLFLILFQFLTRLLTSKHLKLFSTYFVVRNGQMWKTCFQILKMRKKEISWNIKTNCVIDLMLTSLRVYRIILDITRWAHKRQTFTLISIKIMRIWNFFLRINGYLNTRNSFPICMFAFMAPRKCDLHIHITFLQEF
jgi:hypothetical protein